MKSFAVLCLAAPFCLYSLGAAHPSTLLAHEAALDPKEASALSPDLHQADSPAAGARCAFSLRLVDAESGRSLPGLVRITGPDGAIIPLPGLIDRGVKLRADDPAKGWSVLTEPGVIPLPQKKLHLEAFSGIETELAIQDLDLTAKNAYNLTLPLHRFHFPAASGWHNGNTHLHLMNLTRRQSDEYLRTVPRGDGLELVFVSFLSRVNVDKDYITNSYTREDVDSLSGPDLIFGHGEEYRSNFSVTKNTGYGHVMFLQIKRLILPASVGPDLTGSGPDFPPLRHAIDQARSDGATIIWCHGPWGHEEIPDWLAGRLAALNIFDNGLANSYAETFYKYLNVGLKVPFSTGTDWFIYDFSRAYVRVDQPLTVTSWLKALEAGRTFITNGPLLELRAGDHEIGDNVALTRPTPMPVKGRAYGRGDFQRIELVYNGRILATAASHAVGGHFEAELDFPLDVKQSGWLALRVGNGSLDTGGSLVFPVETEPSGKRTALNEMGEALFAHTSPIYFEVAHHPVFEPADARHLIEEMQASVSAIEAKATFATDAQRQEVLKIYQDGIELLQRKLRMAR